MILTTKGIDDLCLKYFVEAGAMAVRRVKKEDLKRIAKATGGNVVVTMADLEGNEAFDAANLGECTSVTEERVGDGELLYFRGCKNGQACTVVLRGMYNTIVRCSGVVILYHIYMLYFPV